MKSTVLIPVGYGLPINSKKILYKGRFESELLSHQWLDRMQYRWCVLVRNWHLYCKGDNIILCASN